MRNTTLFRQCFVFTKFHKRSTQNMTASPLDHPPPTPSDAAPEAQLAADVAALRAQFPETRALYREAREICKTASDYVTLRLFEELLGDEEGHIDYLETQLQLIEQIGIERYGLLQAAAADTAP